MDYGGGVGDTTQTGIRGFIGSFIDAFPYPIYYMDGRGRLIDCNRSFEDFFGVDRARMTGPDGFDGAARGLAESLRAHSADLPRERGSLVRETRIAARGLVHDVIISQTFFSVPDGRTEGILGVIVDISERKKAEAQLRRLTRAVEQSPATVVITDTLGNIEYVNPKFSSLTGYSPQEAMGSNPRILKSGSHPAEFYEELWRTISGGREWRGEFLNKKKNGERYWESASISPVTDDQGVITHYIGVKEDITARKIAEERLRESEERLRERNEAIEEDLRIAQLAQSALDQRGLPRVGFLKIDYRYLPLDRVGGDFFSFTPISERELGVFIGDVTGHGVAAALFLALIRFATEKIAARNALEPAAYLKSLNDELIGYLSSNFITGIYGLFRRTGDAGCEFISANGGHPMAVLIRAGGSSEFIGSSGTILGAFEEARYTETAIRLWRGDRIILYTDGIPEAAREDRERLGFGREILDLFAASNRTSIEETLDAIMDAVAAYRDGEPANDDIVLIGIEAV